MKTSELVIVKSNPILLSSVPSVFRSLAFHLSPLSESLAQVRLRLVMYPIETSNHLTEGKVMILNRRSVVLKADIIVFPKERSLKRIKRQPVL